MPDSPTTRTVRAEDVIRQIRDRDIRSIDLQFTDVTGMIKTVSIDADHLPTALSEGIWFDGSAVEGFARIAESDMYLMPVCPPCPHALGRQPTRNRQQRPSVRCLHPQPPPFAGDTRGSLKRVQAVAKKMGGSLCDRPPNWNFTFFSIAPITAPAQ
jgi:glutamine synthetase